MMSMESYLKNPCRASSIPYWKAKSLALPPHMKIIHEDEWDERLLQNASDEQYFRLIHRLIHIPASSAAGITFHTIAADQNDALADMMNRAYAPSGIRVSADDLRRFAQTQVYCPEGWIDAFSGGKLVGSILCDFDASVGEAVIEWLQVLPEFRRRGIASALVGQALARIKAFADFATVSGSCDNQTHPENVYRRCGFEGHDVWHILRAK